MNRPLSILFAPFGSEGDVRPLLWLAGGMAARGHRITFIITPYYRHLVELRGWRAVDVGAREEFAATMRDPRLWQPRKGTELVLNLMLASLPQYAEILEKTGERFDLVIGTTLGVGAFTWAEKNRIPRLLTHLSPMCLPSVGDCPLLIEGGEWICAAPRFVKRGVFKLMDWYLERHLAGPVNAHRARLGLRPLRSIHQDLWNDAERVAALFPDWYAAAQPDWPSQVRQFGFPQEQPIVAPVSAELEKFFADGEPPILWTHGSANLDTAKFAAGAREATRLLGARGLLVGPAFTAAASAKSFLSVAHAPFTQIFSRCRAIVHHGGIGTSAQALAAGVPQLIVPRSHDQPDNARRLTQVGVAATLAYRKFSGPTAAMKLRGLFSSATTGDACAQFKKKMRESESLSELCVWAEELVG